MTNIQFILSASPFFFGGVSSNGNPSMNLMNSLHSLEEKKFYIESFNKPFDENLILSSTNINKQDLIFK